MQVAESNLEIVDTPCVCVCVCVCVCDYIDKYVMVDRTERTSILVAN